jgi:hypothetical protein
MSPQGDAPFTPEAFPQLSHKACAVLNTPLKDCDPESLERVLSAFAQHISELMSPESGITDPAATLPNLWQRIGTALADTKADTAWPATSDAAPASPTDAVPDAPVVSPDPPVQVPATEPTRLWTNVAPRVSPALLSGPPASDQPADAMIIAGTPQTTPGITAPSAPVAHGSRPLCNSGPSFRFCTESLARWRRRPFRCCRALFPPGMRDVQRLPPPWRLYYAACTGPP